MFSRIFALFVKIGTNMSLRAKTTELKRRMQEAFKGGGEQALEKQKASGK